ncbi:MAG: ABC transporter substrate-binding protein, partial [Halovenus sp.]
EGVMAERDGIDLTPFYLDDYGVPYGYTPLMLASPDTIEEQADDLARFLDATGRGYEFAAANPEKAARILGETAAGPESLDDTDFLIESQHRLADNYLTAEDEWGRMAENRWVEFVEWLADEDILTTIEGDHIPADQIDVADLYTNELLE